MTLLAENFGDLLDPRFRKIFTTEINEAQDQKYIDALFNQMTSTRNSERTSGIGAMGDIPSFNGTLEYGDISQLYDKTVTFPERAYGIKIQRQLSDDDLFGIMDQRPRQMAVSVDRTRGKMGASVFLNAFTLADGGDGVALCSASHPYGPNDATTQSNTGTDSLTALTIEAARKVGMGSIKTNTGEMLEINYDTILCGVDNEEKAWEVINSAGKVDTDKNNRNFHQGRYKLIVWPRITGYKWFMVDSRLAKMYLEWWDRVKPEFNRDQDFDTYVAKWSTYFRCQTNYSDWRWVYGNNATT
jgi:hypothetical protein